MQGDACRARAAFATPPVASPAAGLGGGSPCPRHVPVSGCDSHPSPATGMALQTTAAAREPMGCSSSARERANEHPRMTGGSGADRQRHQHRHQCASVHGTAPGGCSGIQALLEKPLAVGAYTGTGMGTAAHLWVYTLVVCQAVLGPRTPCLCSHRHHAHTVSMLTPCLCSHRDCALTTPNCAPRPAHRAPCFPRSVPGSPARRRGRSPSMGNKLCRGSTSSTPAHPRTPHPPMHPCLRVTPPWPREHCPCCRVNLVLQEPGKNRPGIKLAGAFIAGILFLNAMENTSLEGKSKRASLRDNGVPLSYGECPSCPWVGCRVGAGCGVQSVRQQGPRGADPAPWDAPRAMREARWGHKGQQGWMSPACRHHGGHRVPEKLPWEGTFLSEQDGTLQPEKIQLGIWKLRTVLERLRGTEPPTLPAREVKVGARFNPT